MSLANGSRILDFDASFHTTTILRPLDDRLVVRKDAPPESSHGGILIPDSARTDASVPIIGTVLAVGPGKPCEAGGRHPMTAQVGDEVLLGKYVGSGYAIEGDRLTVVKESEVLAILGERDDAC